MIERINCSDTAMMTKPSEHGAMTKPMDAAARISGMSTSAAPASASSAFVVDVNMIAPWISVRPMGPRYCACARSVHVKMFADQLFALLPKRLGALRIEGVRPHTAAEARHGNHLGDVAVFAIATADRLSIGDTGGPHRSCRTLGNALPAEGRSALGLTGIDLRVQFRHRLRCHVAAQLGSNAPGVHRRRSHPTRFVTAIERAPEQHIGGLGAAIGSET